jgi:2-dehydropantoate 2-reductase
MDIVVLGAGSLGSLLGGLLAREHDVTLVGREPHVGAVADGGLDVVGTESFHVEPAARTDLSERADLAVVAVKSYDTETAAGQLADCSPDACLSVQNGMGNEATLADRLAALVSEGTLRSSVVDDDTRVWWRPGTEQRGQTDRDAFRVRLVDELRPLTDPVEIQETAARILAERLDAHADALPCEPTVAATAAPATPIIRR